MRFRFCINFKLEVGGDGCYGENVMYKSCFIKLCDKNDFFWFFWISWF